MSRLPSCFKQEIPQKDTFKKIAFFRNKKIYTVCQEAHCPNLTRCFQSGCATFMLLGDTCTRACRFCAVKKKKNKKLTVDAQEPQRVVEAVRELGIDYVVLTSVSRDDLLDGGAGQFAKTVKLLKEKFPDIKVELLIPDFLHALEYVLAAQPDVVGHNLETVERLYPQVRAQADYQRSLEVLETIKKIDPQMITKSSLILGMGESQREVMQAIEDLKNVGCDILILGQYLSPSLKHYPVKEFISEEKFYFYRNYALGLGVKAVLAQALARSSYQAKELYWSVREKWTFTM